MRIKTFVSILALGLFLFFLTPMRVSATVTPVSASIFKGDPDAEKYAHIVARVNEIQAMDKSNLTASEKKALRKELQGLNKDASGLDSKVYLSVGAIIIIILLLILILR